MGEGLLVDLSNARLGIAFRRLERSPVHIGRDPDVCRCVIDDLTISRLHVSVDIRNGRIVARDVQSATGTFTRGAKLPGDCWVDLGPIEERQELRAGEWTIGLAFHSVEEQPGLNVMQQQAPAFLASGPTVVPLAKPNAGGPPQYGTPGPAAAAIHRGPSFPTPAPILSPSPAAPPVVATVDLMPEAERVHALLAELRDRMSRFRSVLAAEIEARPSKRRAQLAEALWVRFPELVNEPEIAAVLHRTGFQRGRANVGDASEAALEAIRDLSRALGNEAPPRSAGEIEAFALKLKTGITEILAGYVPLLAGVARFEHEVAIRTRATSTLQYPQGADALARLLFDWQDVSDAGIRFLRSSFADLMTNQIGTLHGVMHGVKSLLDELSPAGLLATWQALQERKGVVARLLSFFGRPSSLWRLFVERYADLADEEHERFRIVFGPEFAEEYRGFKRALRQQANPLPLPGAQGPSGTQVLLPVVDAPRAAHTERMP